ncbi:MAG: hypothetical protein LBU11_04570 [Zoogloeaceae bacterium]|jgi:hypothetical protein|nr:hypothetical protein [Zoogloeaceae bacterium]
MAIIIVFLEVAVLASRRLSLIAQAFQHSARRDAPDQPLGGGIFAGMVHTLCSPYLGGLALLILLYSVTSTFLYFQQASIAEAAFPDHAARMAFFANIDLIINLLTLMFQLFVTGRMLATVGIVTTLCVLLQPDQPRGLRGAWPPSPGIAVIVVAQVTRRVTDFALVAPPGNPVHLQRAKTATKPRISSTRWFIAAVTSSPVGATPTDGHGHDPRADSLERGAAIHSLAGPERLAYPSSIGATGRIITAFPFDP